MLHGIGLEVDIFSKIGNMGIYSNIFFGIIFFSIGKNSFTSGGVLLS